MKHLSDSPAADARLREGEESPGRPSSRAGLWHTGCYWAVYACHKVGGGKVLLDSYETDAEAHVRKRDFAENLEGYAEFWVESKTDPRATRQGVIPSAPAAKAPQPFPRSLPPPARPATRSPSVPPSPPAAPPPVADNKRGRPLTADEKSRRDWFASVPAGTSYDGVLRLAKEAGQPPFSVATYYSLRRHCGWPARHPKRGESTTKTEAGTSVSRPTISGFVTRPPRDPKPQPETSIERDPKIVPGPTAMRNSSTVSETTPLRNPTPESGARSSAEPMLSSEATHSRDPQTPPGTKELRQPDALLEVARLVLRCGGDFAVVRAALDQLEACHKALTGRP